MRTIEQQLVGLVRLVREIESRSECPAEQKSATVGELPRAEVLWRVPSLTYGGDDHKRIKSIMHKCSPSERVDLTSRLIGLYKTTGLPPEERELRQELFESCQFSGLTGTVTQSRKQLRIWYNTPHWPSPDHVDSGGTGLLVGVYGSPFAVEQYVKRIFEKDIGLEGPLSYLKEFEDQIGTRIFMPFDYLRRV